MNIVIAPDSFKEALPAREVCAAIARGVRRAWPNTQIDMIPMADGGEGTVETLIEACGGTLMETLVCGPLGAPVTARWGLLGHPEHTAVVEMAAASGLGLVPPDRRNPMLTTTYGTGELILAALETGVDTIMLGIGGSATNDGGAGAAQAVGVRFYDGEGGICPPRLAGGYLNQVARIDISQRHPRIALTQIKVACDVDNPLCGPHGAAAVYGSQKGATPEQIATLDANLAHWAELIHREMGRTVSDIPGAGAAGGLGAGLMALFDAKLASGIELVMEAVRLAERIAAADLVITGEGRIDRQSMMGKVISGVARTAKDAGVPAIALVGSIGEGAEATLEILDSYHCINPPGMPQHQALARTAEALEAATWDVLAKR
ncbi:MAG: glycerate kinase [Phycisphaerales bacterium]|nr:glycerate kinase [Phycisphaerales bacterium]